MSAREILIHEHSNHILQSTDIYGEWVCSCGGWTRSGLRGEQARTEHSEHTVDCALEMLSAAGHHVN